MRDEEVFAECDALQKPKDLRGGSYDILWHLRAIWNVSRAFHRAQQQLEFVLRLTRLSGPQLGKDIDISGGSLALCSDRGELEGLPLMFL